MKFFNRIILMAFIFALMLQSMRASSILDALTNHDSLIRKSFRIDELYDEQSTCIMACDKCSTEHLNSHKVISKDHIFVVVV